MSIVIFMFSYTKYHFSWISLVFLSGIVIFYCGTWGNMKRCLFLLVFAMNFNVSMKRHMLIVSLFLLVVASTSSACCNMFFFKVSDFLVFPHEIAHFMKVVVFFKAEKCCFYCRSWCNMKGCFFIGICNVFYVSMKRDMLIVTLFFARCVLFQCFHVPWTWR